LFRRSFRPARAGVNSDRSADRDLARRGERYGWWATGRTGPPAGGPDGGPDGARAAGLSAWRGVPRVPSRSVWSTRTRLNAGWNRSTPGWRRGARWSWPPGSGGRTGVVRSSCG